MGFFIGGIWLEVGLGIVAVSVIIYRMWTKDYNFWKDRNVAYIKPTFPFGNMKEFILVKKFLGTIIKEFYDELKGNKYGGIISIRRPVLVIRDPEIIKSVLTKDFHYFTDRGISVPDEKIDPLSAHLFNLNGDRWKILRSKLTPTFTSGKMKMMFGLMSECGKQLQKSLLGHAERGDVIELKDYMARFGTDVIGCCAFGLDIDSINNPDNEFRRITKDIFKPSFSIILNNILNSIVPGMRKLVNLPTNPKERVDFFLKIVGDTVAYREKNNIKRNDFLDLLIEIKNKGHVEDEPIHSNDRNINTIHNINSQEKSTAQKLSNDIDMTTELMTAQCFVFFIAGYETSSTTLSYCLYELALNKHIHNELQKEIDNVLAKHNGDISYEALKEMAYMDKVVQETLRKYPPLGTLTRECVADYKLPDSNLELKKGTRITIPLYGLHYDPEYYPNPEQFDPERFTVEAKTSRPHYTWLPFGEGPRICIGMRFGLLQVKTGLATLLSKYNFDRVPETQVPIEFESKSFTAAPKHGIQLKITKRK